LLKQSFKPEFLNRIDETVFFNMLGRAEVATITEIYLGELRSNLQVLNYHVEWDRDVVEHVVEKGFSPQYGARNIKRTVVRLIEDHLSEMIIDEEVRKGDLVRIGVVDGELAIENAGEYRIDVPTIDSEQAAK
jgi:ATP-dependent Clp protease ATP-binding subunit ClpA